MFDMLDIVEGQIMGVNYFTDEQVEELRNNPYVKHVSNKAITYEDSFKEYFYFQYSSSHTPTQIFATTGFDTKTIGREN